MRTAHLSAPQKFSLRPSAADENIFARVREARALHHDQPRGAQLTALDEACMAPLQAKDTPEHLVPLVSSLDGRPASPPDAAPAPILLTALKHDATSLVAAHALEIPPGRSTSPVPSSPKSKSVSPRITVGPSQTSTQSATTRKRRPPRLATRSASPKAQHLITPPPSRPSSIGGSTTAYLAKADQIKPEHEQPKQVTVSPRRPEQSALVDQMLVAPSGGALTGGSVQALLEVRISTC